MSTVSASNSSSSTSSPSSSNTPSSNVPPAQKGGGLANVQSTLSSAQGQATTNSGKEGCWKKFLNCLRSIPILKYMINYFFPLSQTPPPNQQIQDANAAVRVAILHAFDTGEPQDAAHPNLVALFNSVQGILPKLTIIKELQNNPNCPAAIILKFIDALARQEKNDLYQHTGGAEATDVQGKITKGAQHFATDPKSQASKLGVENFLKSRQSEIEAAKTKLIWANCNSSLDDAQCETNFIMFQEINDPITKLICFGGLLNSVLSVPQLMKFFSNLCPEHIKDLYKHLNTHLQRDHEDRIAAQTRTYTLQLMSARASGTAVPTPQALPAPLSAQTFFQTNPKDRLVKLAFRNVLEGTDTV